MEGVKPSDDMLLLRGYLSCLCDLGVMKRTSVCSFKTGDISFTFDWDDTEVTISDERCDHKVTLTNTIYGIHYDSPKRELCINNSILVRCIDCRT